MIRLQSGPWPLVVVCAACHPTTGLELPDSAQNGTVLLAAVGDQISSVMVFDLSEPNEPPCSTTGDFSLYALEYPCPPSGLGLEAGRAPLLETANPQLRVPPPASISVSKVTDGTQSGWTEQSELSEELRALLMRIDLGSEALCKAHASRLVFQRTAAEIPLQNRVADSFSLALTDESILVGTNTGDVYRVFQTGKVDHLWTLTSTALGAYEAEDGRVWMADAEGKLFVGSLDGTVEELETNTATAATFELDLQGTAHSDPFELYLLNDRGILARLNDARDHWEIVTEGMWGQASLVVLGPSQLYAASAAPQSDRILHLNGARQSSIQVPTEYGRIRTLALIEGIGPIVGTSGGILRIEEDEVVPFDAPIHEEASTDGARAFWGMGDGFGYVGQPGLVMFTYGQYHPVAGFCPVGDLTAGSFPKKALPLNPSVLAVLSFVLDGPKVRINFFDIEPAPSCDAGD